MAAAINGRSSVLGCYQGMVLAKVGRHMEALVLLQVCLAPRCPGVLLDCAEMPAVVGARRGHGMPSFHVPTPLHCRRPLPATQRTPWRGTRRRPCWQRWGVTMTRCPSSLLFRCGGTGVTLHANWVNDATLARGTLHSLLLRHRL